MMSPAEARSLLFSRIQPLEPVTRPLLQSVSYVLAAPICADRDIPSADRAAMDGYALRCDDVQTLPALLQVTAEIPAGSSENPPLQAGQCVRIFTGSVIPDDADTVVMQEDTEAINEGEVAQVRILKRPQKGRHIFRQGENGKKGTILIPAKTCLNPRHVGICAAVGHSQLEVHGKPRTAVLTTGKELKGVGEAVEPHQIRDTNGPTLQTALSVAGFKPNSCRRVEDEETLIHDAVIDLLAEADVLLITGGVSVGKYDLVPDVLNKMGAEVLYHGLNIKPGRPQLCAAWPDSKFIFGLPGNPLSVLVGLHEFVLPVLKRLAGHPVADCYSCTHLPLVEPVYGNGKRQHQQLACLIETPEGPRVKPIPHSGSSDLVAGGQAQGMLIIPAGTREIPAGQLVAYKTWISSL